MTEMSYYPATASPRPPGGPGTPAPVLVAAGGPAAQRRATVAFRVILALPHLLALYLLGASAAVVAVIGWLGALVTGRLPRFAATYLSGCLRWYGRAGAYLLLLTDEYPPFALADAAYPVRVGVSPGRLSRLTAAFRVILAIPAAIVSLLLALGVTIVIPVAWLIALIAGRLPGPLHQALAAVLRYAARCRGYLYLLTGAYPAGLFGDKPGVRDVAGAQDGAALVLTRGAKRLVGLFLVLGLLTVAGATAWAGVTIHAARVRHYEITQLDAAVARHDSAVARHNAAVSSEQGAVTEADNAIIQLGAANGTLNSVLNSVLSKIDACGTVTCFDTSSVPAVNGFAAFEGTLRALPVPAAAAAAKNKLAADTASNEQGWTSMAHSVSFGDYEDKATATETAGGRFDNDYPALMATLDKASTALEAQGAALNKAGATLNGQAAALSRRAAVLNVQIANAHVDMANSGS
jgi:hypothetical protein